MLHGIEFVKAIGLVVGAGGPPDPDGMAAQSLHAPGVVPANVPSAYHQNGGAFRRLASAKVVPEMSLLLVPVKMELSEVHEGYGNHVFPDAGTIGAGGVGQNDTFA